MRILLFSDVHNDKKALERVVSTEAELYICAGDLVSWARGLDDCGEILRPLAGRLLVIPGNHESERDISLFAEKFGFHAVHGQRLELNNRQVGFLGYSNPTPFDTPGEYSEEELARRLRLLAEDGSAKLDALICHCPPFETDLDRMRNGGHAGSTAIREFLERYQPRWFFSGHIHETEGVTTKIGETTGHNPGKRGFLLDF